MMDGLWAPWRREYFLNKSNGCIFCENPAEDKDEDNFIVKRSRHSFSMLNIYPYNNGHLMVAPYRHTADLLSLNDEEILDIMNLLKETQKKLKEILSPEGFNVGLNIGKVGGAGFAEHIHFHIVPRWTGDTNFMPVIGKTKVIGESLEELYGRMVS